jgi:G3E family GTPase
MIRNNTIIRIHYTMKNGRGEVLENQTVTYLHGSASISPTLQSQLQGLEVGQQKQVFLKKGQEDADDDFIFDITVEAIREVTAREPENGPPATAIKLHLLSGFLGSGKTTAIREAIKYLDKQHIPVAVITNDQGSHLVDGNLFTHLGVPAGEVTGGCFCCNYNDLDRAIRYLAGHLGAETSHAHKSPAVIFAESVGSCTDLVATVLKPLLKHHPEWQPTITILADAQLLNDEATGFDETINYIYNKQLEEAKIIVVTKIDRLKDTTQLRKTLQTRYPDKTIIYQNSFDETHIARWLHTLDTTAFTQDLPSLDIDYGTYGAGEAKLAWLDQELEIESPSQQAQHAALALIEKIAQTRYPIGHLKFLLDGQTKISYTSTSVTGHPTPQPAAAPSPQPAARTTLLINARIQTAPPTLSQHVSASIQAIEKEQGCTIRTLTESCFQPGYPRPTHRL